MESLDKADTVYMDNRPKLKKGDKHRVFYKTLFERPWVEFFSGYAKGTAIEYLLTGPAGVTGQRDLVANEALAGCQE